ncbi:hypothetical protein RND71_011277 [Anisodus tanguticus]|uniref:Uncharacterized protein n=1 Tax=Anisodus tanguticus TaxID=243964 RepID=A0AAE1SCF7_9SOLA|nr:hypothetical protein RND71_011277 [Anisodus tanguticus]
MPTKGRAETFGEIIVIHTFLSIGLYSGKCFYLNDMTTTEAESLSQNQQRRIDELEAQLNEAEGLIIDLRAELHDVHEH